MLSEHRPGVPLATLAPSLTPEPKGIVLSLSTIARPPLHRERPVWLDRPHRQAEDRFVPSVSAPSPRLSRSCQQSLSEQCRPCWRGDTIVVSIARLGPSMQWKPVSNDFQPPPVQPVGSVRSMSRTNTFKRTRAPPSLRPTSSPEHPCCCVGCAVVAKSVEWTATPATANRKGNRSLRRRSTRKGAESILDNRLVRKETNGLLANGPHCDLIMALSWSRNTGHTPFFKWYRSIDEAACCCQPVCG